MAKSRVEKNKALYDELELESFELEDIGAPSKTETAKPEVEEKKEIEVQWTQALPVAKKQKKNEVAVVEDKKEINLEEEFVVEQPISYTDKLSVEEILRAKLEKQQKLKDSKKGYKKSPITDTYTPEMMQKNINQKEGIDIRKEANIKIRKNNNTAIALLVLLLIAVIVAGVVIVYVIL